MSETKGKNFLPIGREVIVAYLLFLIANIIYLHVFAMNASMYLEDINAGDYFFCPLNLDQEAAYIPYMKMMEEGSLIRGWTNNNLGIAYVYYFLKKSMDFSYDAIPIVSFIVNNIFILFSYWYFVKIGIKLGLKMKYRWLFFLNPSLVYFSHLINKEILSLFFVLAFTYYLAQKQSFKLLSFSLLSFITRMPLLPIGILSFWLYRRRRYILSLFLLYLVTSIVTAIVISPSFMLDSGELRHGSDVPGMVFLTQSLNQQYYVGSILLNPVKIVQYLYDLLCSVFFITDDGKINLYLLHEVPFALVLVYLFRPLMTLFTRMQIYLNSPCRPLITVTCIYMMILLMHPLVHARYLFPISYNVVLLGIFVALDLKRSAKVRKIGIKLRSQDAVT